jgi:hypothetical protein
VTWLGDPGIEGQTVELNDVPLGASSVLPGNALGLAPSAVPFRVSEYAGVLEIEPNNKNEEATPGAVPGAFDGVIQEDGDVDRYSFEGKKGRVFNARVWARKMGSPLDSILTVHAPSGKQVLFNDDGRGLDSYGRITLPEDGKYLLMVRDHLRRGGETFAYRVELTPVQPNMKITQRRQGKILATVTQGNRAALYLGVTRSDFGGPVQLILENLPAGVVATYGELANGQTELPVLLTAAADAALAGSLVSVTGTGKKGEQTITGSFYQDHPVVLGRNKVVIMDTPIRGVAMAVGKKAPFSIDITPLKTPVIQGGSKHLKVLVKRDEGFTKPIKVTIPFYPPGLNGGTLDIPEGKNEGVFTVEAKGNAPLGDTQLLAVATSQGYSVASEFVPIQIEAQWMTVEVDELRLEQGTSVSVAVKLNHVKEFEGEFELRLYRLPKGVSTVNQKVTHATTEVVFPLTIAADAPDGKHGVIAFAMDIEKEGEYLRHRFAGKKLTIFKPLPPAVKKAAPKPAPKPKAGEKPKPKRRTRFPETLQ